MNRALRVLVLFACLLLTAAVTAAPAAAARRQVSSPAITITGVDLHDGTMLAANGIYYLYGTEYGCGFQWGIAGTPWCGFGVSTAPSPTGPWSAPRLLFSPSDVNAYGLTWSNDCGSTGAGCFNPRMIQRSGWGADDGVWILWFNTPADNWRTGANAYWSMGCNGPTGPCGATAGPPYGSTAKPSMYGCTGDGDFSLVGDAPRAPMMLCTMGDGTLSSERIGFWGAAGVGGGRTNLAGIGPSEGVGGYRDASGTWVMTYSDPNCGYCTGTGTGYATAPAVDGAYTAPVGLVPGGAPPPAGRRGISATSCGGQPRTVVTLNGQPYQFIDLWLGTRNETAAAIHLEPLIYNGAAPNGSPLHAFTAWSCR